MGSRTSRNSLQVFSAYLEIVYKIVNFCKIVTSRFLALKYRGTLPCYISAYFEIVYKLLIVAKLLICDFELWNIAEHIPAILAHIWVLFININCWKIVNSRFGALGYRWTHPNVDLQKLQIVYTVSYESF